MNRDDELRLWELLRNEPPEPSIEQMREEYLADNEWERDNYPVPSRTLKTEAEE